MIKSICRQEKNIGLAALAISFLLFPGFAVAQQRNETIAASGQTAPDGNGTFSSFFDPTLNNSGELAFTANLVGTSGGSLDDRGIFRGNGAVTTQIAREGQIAPDGNGTISTVAIFPVINNFGATAFHAFFTGTSGGDLDNSGIFRGNGEAITQIAREGQTAPDGNGMFSSFSLLPVLNDSGAAAFSASLIGTSGGTLDSGGVFRGSGGAITQIARKGQAAPDANGMFSFFFSPVLNGSGEVAFSAFLEGTSGGNDNTGIFRGNGGAITQIVRNGQAAPDANGTFSNLTGLVLNDSGEAAFAASLTGTSGGNADNSGIFRGAGGAITQIAREGQAAPGGNGAFSGFERPVMNESGAAAFQASLIGTSGGSTDDSGIFRGNGGVITQIVREGQATPDANGTFSVFTDPALNDSGAAAFAAGVTGSSGGSSDNAGIFIGDGIDLIQVVRRGDLINGSAITQFGFDNRGSLNDFGQVGYRVILANGDQSIQRFTPDLHWRSTSSSTWDTAGRWTLGLNPGDPHDVFIDPAASLTVTGPAADTTVRSLRIGGGTGLATLSLRNGTLTATNGVSIVDKGMLAGDGVIAGNVVNNIGGAINAANLTINGIATNFGVVRGSGSISATEFYNESSGKIRALSGASMNFSGTNFSNSGLIEIHDSELQVGPQINNRSGGTSLISLRDGSLIADAGINNEGSIAMTVGNSIIQGDIDNSGIIQVSGGAHATFFGDVLQNGTMQVASVGNTTSTAVLLGSFSGNGGFVGGGDVFALGDLRPGNSPASVLYDGNLFLGSSTDTFIELGGLEIGEFDQLLVTGELNLAGDLFVSLIDGYVLGANQSYLIGDIGGSLLGQFNGLGEGALVGNFGGRDLFITYSASGGNDIALFTAVPEPATGMAGLVCVFGILLISRRRRVG